MHNLEKSQVVLAKYRKFYPKSLNESLTTHISIAPSHPAVIPIHVDDKILRKMNAADYCDSVRKIVRQMRSIEDGIYSTILYNKFLVMRTVYDEFQCRRMGIGSSTFYRKLNHAFKLFSEVIPPKLLNHLYKMAIK